MKKIIIIVSLITAAIFVLFYGLNHLQAANEPFSGEEVEMPDLKGWPEASQKAAKDMQSKYGNPNGVTPDMLVWNNNGIWLKTIVYKKEMKHDFPKPHTDVIEQWINYSVPLNNYDEVALYDGSVTVNRTNGTVSARCDNEGMNILAINLTYDITKNKVTVDEARMNYGKDAMAFMNGEKPGYTQKLNFASDPSSPDPDEPLDMDMMAPVKDMGAE